MAHGDAQLPPDELHRISLALLREWLYDSYPPEQRGAILDRVLWNVARRPGSYLARNWRKIYRESGR